MIWKGKYQAGRWFLLLHFLTSAQRKEVRRFSVLQNENVIYMIIRIIRVEKHRYNYKMPTQCAPRPIENYNCTYSFFRDI